jgi:hypothetical protein
MTLYRHVHTPLTVEQEANYVRLARHLVISSQSPEWDANLFDMTYIAYDLITGEDVAPERVADHIGPLLCGALGHGPRAGIAALAAEGWRAYQTRILAAEIDSPLEDWLLSFSWRKTDNSPIGAAMRLMYVLDYGVPIDWLDIVEGRARSDYLENGFLWDRVGLAPPDRA